MTFSPAALAWAWKHFMTKNYADIEKVLTALVEGEQT